MCVVSSTAAGQLVTTLYNSPLSSGVGQGNTIAWSDVPAARGKPNQAANQGTRVGQHRARPGKARRGEVCVWRNSQPQPTEARLHRGGASPHSCLVLIRPTFSFSASSMLVEKPTTLPLPRPAPEGVQAVGAWDSIYAGVSLWRVSCYLARLSAYFCFKSYIRMDAEIVVVGFRNYK